ncbi:E1 [Canis familiaris papillomavirus 19]|uniref:Replication protein E1 n=1 Tax=Canis familiaris papillomavirus 19 TaxID=2759773 RepID=A0A1C9J6S9_9PAPI|nr:E1 [Canis familiaris papillomavirus 19]
MAEEGERGNEDVEGDGGWFLVSQADCSDADDDFDCLLDASADTNISDLIDDNVVEGDNVDHARLLNLQRLEQDLSQLGGPKRKYLTPSPKGTSPNDLSPSLQAVSLSPRPKNSKRRLFQDSGIESINNETEDSVTRGETQVSQNGGADAEYDSDPVSASLTILQSSNQEATILSKFKGAFGTGFKELTRPYKSSKTCCHDWVVFVFGAREDVLVASKTLLKQQCDFFLMTIETGGLGYMGLYLLQFNVAKSRETLTKAFCQMLSVKDFQVRADPPKNRSVAVCLYFYKLSLSRASYKHGDFPPWLSKQLLISHQQDTETFDLSKMIQWAYDQGYTDESEIAFHYAVYAEEDANAAAWLKCNGQARFVADCAKMVRHYKRHQMRMMTSSQWVYHCCGLAGSEEGDWTVVAKYLKYQNVSFLAFLGALRHMLDGTPKKQCLLIYGPPDTGKSWFCFSLLSFLHGKVVSFVNSRSHFWLSPLADCKIGMLDDATYPCLSFIDMNMRSAFDGNYVSVDCKHKNPVQIKLPPMLVTSNIDLKAEPTLQYLHSRFTCLEFPRKFPINPDGSPVFSLTSSVWKAFFQKLHHQLGLDPEEEANDGEPGQTFRCTARCDAASL